MLRRNTFSATLVAAALVSGSLFVGSGTALGGRGKDCFFGQRPTHRGTAGDDVIRGTPGDDRIVTGDGRDLIYARGGNDLVCAGSGRDVVHGGAGRDTIDLGDGRDSAKGGRGNDRLDGGAGRDRISGNGGADHFSWPGNNDLLNGGNGRDAVGIVTRGRTVVDLKKGRVTGDHRARLKRIENVFGGPGTNIFKGDEKRNVLTSVGRGRLIGRGGDDLIDPGGSFYPHRIHGGRGTDLVDYGRADYEFVEIDLLYGYAEIGNNSLNPMRTDRLDSIESIRGSMGDDFIYGDGKRNALDGGPGNDTVSGRAGDDRLFGGDGHDLLIGGPGSDFLSGGEGSDSIAFDPGVSAGVTVDLARGTSEGGGGEDLLSSIENVVGTRWPDILIGDSGPNSLHGNEGDDMISGEGGDDHLDGGADDDTGDGGEGYDRCLETETMEQCETSEP